MSFNIAKIGQLYKGSRDKTYNLTYRHTPKNAQLKNKILVMQKSFSTTYTTIIHIILNSFKFAISVSTT